MRLIDADKLECVSATIPHAVILTATTSWKVVHGCRFQIRGKETRMSDFGKDINVPINDCISRQAAIDGLYEMASDADYLCTVSDYVLFLESLPSAQPERMCHRCRYEKHGSVVCDNCSRFFLDRYEVDNNE